MMARLLRSHSTLIDTFSGAASDRHFVLGNSKKVCVSSEHLLITSRSRRHPYIHHTHRSSQKHQKSHTISYFFIWRTSDTNPDLLSGIRKEKKSARVVLQLTVHRARGVYFTVICAQEWLQKKRKAMPDMNQVFFGSDRRARGTMVHGSARVTATQTTVRGRVICCASSDPVKLAESKRDVSESRSCYEEETFVR